MRAPLASTLLLAVLCACSAPAPRGEAPAAASAGEFPHAFYADPPRAGRVFRLDPAASRLQLRVFRAGALARRGHNHLVVAGDFEGAVFVPERGLAEARMDLHVPVAALQVDPPALRTAAGAAFAAAVDDQARAGTRENLLGPSVLDAARHPVIAVHAMVLAGELPMLALELRLSVRGRTHSQRVPVLVQLDGDRLRARGALVLRQSDLGIAPFSAVAGLLQVADALVLEFDLAASATPAQR